MSEDNIENIKQIVKSMRQTGASEEEIRRNLEQLGLEAGKIDSILHKTNSNKEEKNEEEKKSDSKPKERKEKNIEDEEDSEELEKKIEGISEGFESITDKIEEIDKGVKEKESVEKDSEEDSVKSQKDSEDVSEDSDDLSKDFSKEMVPEGTEEDLSGVSNKEIYEEVRKAKNKVSALMNIEKKILKTNKDILIELREKEKKKKN